MGPQMENVPPPKPGREPKVVPEERRQEILRQHADALRNFSRSYLTIIIEFSSHSQLLADQNFFRWMHTMLCQFIEQSIEKGDKNLEEAVQLELHRLFQGDRFNVEAKKPEQILRVHKRPIRKWAMNRQCELTLGKEMQRNSPVVTTVLPSASQRIQKMLKDLDDFRHSPPSKSRPPSREMLARPSPWSHDSPGIKNEAPETSPKLSITRPHTSLGPRTGASRPNSPDWVLQSIGKV